jgi:hypothetical protein
MNEAVRIPRPTGTLFVFLWLSLVFVGAGVWMLTAGEAWGWLPIGFFGLGALVFAALLCSDSGLTLDAEGFEMRTLFRRKRYRWKEVSEFSILEVQSSAQIMFDDLTILDHPFARITRFLLGRNSSIPIAIIGGGTLEEMCARLNAYREEAMAGRG